MCLPYQSFILFAKSNKSGKVTSVQEKILHKLFLRDQCGCFGVGSFQHSYFLLFIFPCLLMMFVIPHAVLGWCECSAPGSAGMLPSPGSGICAF